MDPDKQGRTNSRCWGQGPKKAVVRRPLQLLYQFEVSCATNEKCRPKSELEQSEQLAWGLVRVNRERRKEAGEGKRLRRQWIAELQDKQSLLLTYLYCYVLIFPFANLRTVCQVFISWFKQWAVNHSMVNRRKCTRRWFRNESAFGYSWNVVSTRNHFNIVWWVESIEISVFRWMAVVIQEKSLRNLKL